jgi:hypothetical protein
MNIARFVAASLVLGLVACSSSNTPSTEQDKGLEGTGESAANSAPDTNPDGVPYPTDGIGTLPRKGSTPGNRIANFKFLGFPDADTSGGLKPISLAQFFDPAGKKYKIIHIQASGVWCYYCQEETKTVAQMQADLEAKGAVWLMSLAEGRTQGTPSTQVDLESWIKNYKAPYTQWIDPGNQKLGPFYHAEALPWNANIDARTMEILTAQEGAATEKAQILQEIDDALTAAQSSKLTGSPQ